ncbi:MAG: ATP-binding cassette domain-containing protein [Rhodospirillales bacterium]|jgi:branched-chain amino acid transport system ATP-binding protein|nr:ATP-binding cassette domain-containing protein [Rhodospirillales bacterium]
MDNLQAVLDVRDLTMDFGGLRAVDNVSFDIRPREIVALIGPNGAGKTTVFNCITGLYEPSAGDVYITGNDKTHRLNGLKPNHVTELGMARTFQNIRLFQNMTVLENVMIGRHCRTKSAIFGAIVRPPSTRREEQEVIDDSYALLVEMGLETFVDENAGSLPYGAQRRLEIARAMATEPKVLLLDEPAAGMNPMETGELQALIIRLREKHDLSILLIEHDMKLVMSLSDRVFVLEYGTEIAQGTPEVVSKDPRVIKAYLGEDDDA